jgi:peroxiredoxin (alkyl hydroperoxide reductase subunit C)
MDSNALPASAAPAARPLRIGEKAPVFRARSTQGDVSLDQYRGRWLVFFSHPADFTPVCTSEFVALSRAAPRFEAMGCALLGLSVDSLYAHVAWVRAIQESFGVDVPFPIVEDASMVIGRAYGMIDDAALDSSSMRASYFIDPEGVIRAITWYPLTVGRSVEEMLRIVAALQRSAAGDVMTPEGWRPGDDLLLPPDQTMPDALKPGAPSAWFYRTRKENAR